MTQSTDLGNETKSALFDRVGSEFLHHYDTARGMIRRELVRRDIVSELDCRSLDLRELGPVLDVGCGDGQDAIWLARRGYDVFGVDLSAQMIRNAQESAAAESDEVRKRLTFIQGDEAWALQKLGPDSCSVVMCHGVLMYQDNDEKFLEPLSTVLAPGGILSLVTKNASALAFRAAAEGDYSEARSLLSEALSMGNLGVATRGHSIQQLADSLYRLGLLVSSWYGIRIFSDGLGDAPPPPDMDSLLELEAQASSREPYKHSGRLLHLIATNTMDRDAL